MDVLTREQWMTIVDETISAQPRVGLNLLAMVRGLSDVYCMVKHHQDFQGRYYHEHLGMDPNLRVKHEGQPWYELAERFADQWDQKSFDPSFTSEPLEHFEPLVLRVFAQAKSL